MKNDLQNMSIKQLKKYILEHREDQEACTVFMDKIDAQPTDKIYTADDVEQFTEIFKKEQKSSV